jgi:hypothetical protein
MHGPDVLLLGHTFLCQTEHDSNFCDDAKQLVGYWGEEFEGRLPA